jgi:hypothetical protein
VFPELLICTTKDWRESVLKRNCKSERKRGKSKREEKQVLEVELRADGEIDRDDDMFESREFGYKG